MEFLSKLLNLPDVASAHGPALDQFLVYIHLLMAILFVGWFGYFLYVIFRFRRSANPKADYVGAKSHFSSYAEVGVAAIEALLLLGFAVPLWAKAVYDLPEKTGNAKTDPIEIAIMGQQFAWNAHYAGPDNQWGKQDIKFANANNPFGLDSNDAAAKDDVTCLREAFLVPVDRDIICRVSSMDVIHCFKLPRMRVTQDCIPGMTFPVHFKATKTGDFMIICAQLCGNLHSTMKGEFKVVSEPEYAEWFAKKAAAGGAQSFE